jgi:hypothetical protein
MSSMSRNYTKFINQADYRREECTITFSDWCQMWEGRWHRRGRTREDLCISRIDWSEPWHTANVEIIPRYEHLAKKNYKTMGIL